MRGMGLAVAAVLALAACKPVGAAKVEPVGQQRVDQLHADCVGRGGEFLRLGQGEIFYCVEKPKDSGRYCTSAGDCESACLARSRTCAPVKPLFGCNEVLNEAGVEVTECLD